MTPQDHKEITTWNQPDHKREKASTWSSMIIGKEQEAQHLEGIEETTAQDMNMKIMATEDTLAMRDEDTAQGP